MHGEFIKSLWHVPSPALSTTYYILHTKKNLFLDAVAPENLEWGEKVSRISSPSLLSPHKNLLESRICIRIILPYKATFSLRKNV